MFSKKKSEDKARRVGSSAIFEKDFGSLAAAQIKDSDVQTVCAMLLVASTSRRPIE
jgi:hypothetical protein